jgi:hypothetical protein
VATEDGTTDNGRGEHRQDTNVVPFPGDWIGPRDELVPVGRPVERSGPPLGLIAGEEQREATGSASQAGGSDVLPPFTPDTFWSEHSDAIHDVLKAPASAPELPARRSRPWQAVPGLLPATIAWVRRRAPSASWPRGRSVRQPSMRQVTMLLALTAVAVVFAPVVASRLAGGSRQHPSAVARVGTPAPGETAAASGRRAVSASPYSGAGAAPVIRPRPHLAGGRHRARRVHGRRSRTSTSGIFVSDSVPASSGGSGQRGSSAGSPGPSGGGQAHADSGTSNRSSAPAGPIGPGAPFGPGQLG